MKSILGRRQFLKTIAGTSALSILAACGAAPAVTESPAATSAPVEAVAEPTVALEPTVAPTPAPILVGEGEIPITMWVQDFAPAVEMFKTAATAVSKTTGNLKVNVQPIPFSDLLAKMLPSIAAGTEADVMMGYTDWYVATDISKLFLPLDEIMGGRAALEELVYAEALATLDTPGGKTYYVPWAAGLRAAATTVNVNQYKEAGLDYNTFTSWELLEEAGKKLTTFENDKMTRAGLSPIGAALSLVKTWIWQTGGEFYDKESGTWTFATPEGEAAAQRVYDLFWKTPTSSFDLFTNEYEGFTQQIISTQLDGAWTAGVQEAANPDLKCDVIPTPALTGAKNDVVYPEHIGVMTLSRRLAQDEQKLKPSAELLTSMVSADALLSLMETYSGSVMSKVLYADPRLDATKYGTVSKRIAEATWPRAKFPQDHVANQTPAVDELTRGLRKEISIKDALTNMDTYLNEQEAQARERIGG